MAHDALDDLAHAGRARLVRRLPRAEARGRRRRRAARTQLDSVADFTHRLKTPLTSISLCADLARAGRLSAARRRDSLDTIARETAKLNTLVDEVLAYVKACRHV